MTLCQEFFVTCENNRDRSLWLGITGRSYIVRYVVTAQL